MKLLRFSSLSRLYDATAARFARLAQQSIRERGCFAVLLSGGTTPLPLYHRLTDSPWRESVDWQNVLIGWSDERCVPPDHPASNYHMAHDALLAHVPVPPEQVFRIEGEADPTVEAAAYASRVERRFGPGGTPDLILLGLGTDGHTASLFPGDPALDVQDRLFVAVQRPTAVPAWRITATLPLLNSARDTLFLVTGAEKSQALAAVRHGEDLPATRVAPVCGNVVWMADEAACTQC